MTERKEPRPGDLVILSHPAWNCLLYAESYYAMAEGVPGVIGQAPRGPTNNFVNGEMKYGEVAIVIGTLSAPARVCKILTSELRSGWLRLEYVAKAKKIL